MKTLNALFREVILANELSNNISFALRFSDPDGVRSGKSGWSFGVCQFDTKNNDQALRCLRECGFTDDEIRGIVHQTIDVKPFAARLKASADIIARYDEQQLSYCLNKALNFADQRLFMFRSPDGILAAADYINQYGSMGDGSAAFYRKLKRDATAEDVLEFKLKQTKYGKEHPADCHRRYTNIKKVLKEYEDGKVSHG